MKIINKSIAFLMAIVFLASCKKESLNIVNPNEPTAQALTTEAGIKAFALGIYYRGFGGQSFTNAWGNHEIMGDEILIPWGNFGWRWVSQVYKITLPNGKVINNPIGPLQKDQLASTNSRTAGESNSLQYEWDAMYLMLAQANDLLKAAENSSLTLSGETDAKKTFIKGWALWWKGYAYSRIGSIYIAGIISPESGSTNPNFVDHNKIIEEANRNLDLANAEFAKLSSGATYTEMFKAVVPDFNDNNKVVTPVMMQRHINTLKARNLLANKKTKAMTSADWTAVLNLANNGLQQGDFPLVIGNTASGNNSLNWLAEQPWHPAFLTADGWWFVSPRHIQEYKSGDNRLDKNFVDYGPDDPLILNPRGRGIQYGTSYDFVHVEDGGTFASYTKNLERYILSGSYEENELMKAEAKINLGQVEEGLGHIDNVRNFQASGLSSVKGTGLTAAQAKEELRIERRVALFFRGVAFYDARRWGVTDPASQGGGRTGAVVLVPPGSSYMNLSSPEYHPTYMEYNYVDYWDVPQNELDFNQPATGAAKVKN